MKTTFILLMLFSGLVKAQDQFCEEKKLLHEAFHATSFESRSSIGKDQLIPVENDIKDFLAANKVHVTEIGIIALGSHLPFWVSKQIDPNSENRNLDLVGSRADFASQMLLKLKNGTDQLKQANVKVSSSLAGPKFNYIDLNERFVTKMSSMYQVNLQKLFDANKEEYAKVMITAVDQLKDESKFENIYKAHFKPFEGFKLSIYGCSKDKKEGKPASGAKSTNQ